ncbi:hypothetical protein CHS0354_011996 [Potamilus streckersoni]|uniref:Uncharacterized protein n=1 Tax=Potamilus streckersoni TaxID=2493646 RepID=A0AAE0SBF1_9BIVA|nr:hypothetical protein CHS0354_011996 [Potamilus streckersoni]
MSSYTVHCNKEHFCLHIQSPKIPDTSVHIQFTLIGDTSILKYGLHLSSVNLISVRYTDIFFNNYRRERFEKLGEGSDRTKRAPTCDLYWVAQQMIENYYRMLNSIIGNIGKK